MPHLLEGRKTLTIRTHQIKEVGQLQGQLRSHSAINNYKAVGFAAQAP